MIDKLIIVSNKLAGILALIGLVAILLVAFCVFFRKNIKSIASNAVDVGKSVIYASYMDHQALKEKERTINRIMTAVSKEMEYRHQTKPKGPIVEELDDFGNVIKTSQTLSLNQQLLKPCINCKPISH